TVSAPRECAWEVAGLPNWVTVTPLGGNGPETLKVSTSANTGPSRAAVLTVGGRQLRVEQAALPPCTYTVTADQFTVSRKKQSVKIDVTTQSNCQWSATSSASWARVPSGVKTGTGRLEVKIDDYSRSGSRSAIVTVIGANFTKEVSITQSGGDQDGNVRTASRRRNCSLSRRPRARALLSGLQLEPIRSGIPGWGDGTETSAGSSITACSPRRSEERRV